MLFGIKYQIPNFVHVEDKSHLDILKFSLNSQDSVYLGKNNQKKGMKLIQARFLNTSITVS